MTRSADESGSKTYRYRSDGEEHGPVGAHELMELFATHMISAFDEVQVEGESAWVAAQTVVGDLLESKANAAAPRPSPIAATRSATSAASVPPAQQPAPPLIMPQRGAHAPKPEGSISDAELAESIAYARRRMQRATRLRLAIPVVLLVVGVVVGLRYSANLRSASPARDVAFHTDTRITLAATEAAIATAHGTAGTYTVVRVRDVTYGSDGTVSMAVHDEPLRWSADLNGAPDHNEIKKAALRDRTITFAVGADGWVPTLSGDTPPMMSAWKLQAVAFDNAALFPEGRRWPWSSQPWVVSHPQACSVFALDVESCKAEVRLNFTGFVTYNGDRCARVTFEGEWEGVSEGDKLKLSLSGEVLRSLSQGVDLSVQATGTMKVGRVVTGGAAPSDASMAGPVTYSQTTISTSAPR